MSKRVIKFIIGLMLIVVSRQNRTKRQEERHDCRIIKKEGLLTADCAKDKIKSRRVPQDLDPNIEVLDISSNLFNKFASFSFKKYRSLQKLKMRFITREDMTSAKEIVRANQVDLGRIDLEPDIFTPLKKLKVLEMSFSFYGSPVPVVWPKSLETLIVDAIFVEELNVDTLVHLTELSARINQLSSLPKIHPNAPLKSLNVSQNPLKVLLAEDLAPFCQLTRLGITSDLEDTDVNKQWFYCDCQRLIQWFKNFKIQGLETFACYEFGVKEKVPKCNLTFDPEALATRKKCLNALKKGTASLSIFWKIGITLLMVFLMALTAGIFWYIADTRLKESGESELEEKEKVDEEEKEVEEKELEEKEVEEKEQEEKEEEEKEEEVKEEEEEEKDEEGKEEREKEEKEKDNEGDEEEEKEPEKEVKKKKPRSWLIPMDGSSIVSR